MKLKLINPYLEIIICKIQLTCTRSHIFKVLKCVAFCVFYMTYYNLHNSVKSPPKMQEMAFQWLEISKISPGLPQTFLAHNCHPPPPNFLYPATALYHIHYKPKSCGYDLIQHYKARISLRSCLLLGGGTGRFSSRVYMRMFLPWTICKVRIISSRQSGTECLYDKHVYIIPLYLGFPDEKRPRKILSI